MPLQSLAIPRDCHRRSATGSAEDGSPSPRPHRQAPSSSGVTRRHTQKRPFGGGPHPCMLQILFLQVEQVGYAARARRWSGNNARRTVVRLYASGFSTIGFQQVMRAAFLGSRLKDAAWRAGRTSSTQNARKCLVVTVRFASPMPPSAGRFRRYAIVVAPIRRSRR